MELLVCADGNSRCVYSEAIDLSVLGKISIQRGSHVEPDQEGKWIADLSPVNGPQLGPFTNRSEALKAEMDWLREHWLVPPS
ncbi:hypothetical protein [Roseiconus lacunae]|uniref:Uncharacterized protein n=1 Tax=Roseiconus lacunae TaxID=2605694 RepID=A0ABT7PNS4_9BACT|nr:hypothetical protein [Roseiconus lacunae]MDM4018157.1 hypothetical protein [Roseiconus lacunae]